MVQALHIRGAQIWDHGKQSGNMLECRDLFTRGERIAPEAAPDALTVDLEGHTVFPGLINAHDHLELNHYPRSKFRERYDNAHQWGEDMSARLNAEPYRSLRAYPLEDRCFIGGLKNLLCGALTVAHHNPPHKCLFHKDFPVRVLREYGWAHSLHFNTAEEIIQSYRSTPKDWPWFIHLAEGTDAVAAGEYQRLKAMGCVGKNTVFIHGIGILSEDMDDAAKQCRGLIRCPSTNRFLLGTETPYSENSEGWWLLGFGEGRYWGSDSRLTADGDLLDEIREACAPPYRANSELGRIHLNGLVTSATICPAQLLGSNNGSMVVDKYADFLITKTITPHNSAFDLLSSHRADLALIIRSGVPQIGAPELMAKFPQVPTVAATLDGVPKAIHRDLAQRIHRCTLKEPGLEVEKPAGRRFAAFTPWKSS